MTGPLAQQFAREELPEESVVDDGERFDPFCHTLDGQRRALCLADVRGRRVHNRGIGTSSSAWPTHCQTCQRALCPTCAEVERLTRGAA